MADKNLIQVDGGQTTSPSNGRIYIIKPAATPSGFQDYWISESDLHSALSTLISTNTSNISSLDTRVTTVENSLLKTKISSTGTTTFSMPASSILMWFSLKYISGTPVVKVGTTSGGEELLSETTLNSLADGFTNTLNWQFNSTTTIYITVTGGLIDFTRFTQINIFN